MGCGVQGTRASRCPSTLPLSLPLPLPLTLTLSLTLTLTLTLTLRYTCEQMPVNGGSFQEYYDGGSFTNWAQISGPRFEGVKGYVT